MARSLGFVELVDFGGQDEIFQNPQSYLEICLSTKPFALWNRGLALSGASSHQMRCSIS
jgi:hypothetical protein